MKYICVKIFAVLLAGVSYAYASKTPCMKLTAENSSHDNILEHQVPVLFGDYNNAIHGSRFKKLNQSFKYDFNPECSQSHKGKVATLDGWLFGGVVFYRCNTVDMSPCSQHNCWLIERLMVHRLCHKAGYGKALMQHAQDTIREFGGKRIHLYASTTNVGFYEKLGFVKESAEADRDGSFHMIKELSGTDKK